MNPRFRAIAVKNLQWMNSSDQDDTGPGWEIKASIILKRNLFINKNSSAMIYDLRWAIYDLRFFHRIIDLRSKIVNRQS
ncbi:hypothetical protein A2V82_09090 [candidate division KSB1 bacterium RBG_16_48_16]|nr:MAG: hypothetical protein A2V82_09090 [candidate division KSB1 bacterium RBG_16_48_16]